MPDFEDPVRTAVGELCGEVYPFLHGRQSCRCSLPADHEPGHMCEHRTHWVRTPR